MSFKQRLDDEYLQKWYDALENTNTYITSKINILKRNLVLNSFKTI